MHGRGIDAAYVLFDGILTNPWKHHHMYWSYYPLSYAYYKVEAVEEHVGTFLDDPLNGKLLIFAHHKNVIERLCR